MNADPVRRLYLSGAVLFGLGALTGGLISAQVSGQIDAHLESLLGTHLNGLLGCFWLICVGTTWNRVNLSDRQAQILVASTVLAAYANWGVTLIKSFLKVQGINFSGQLSNDVVFGVLTLFVVVPTLLSATLWVKGLWRSETT